MLLQVYQLFSILKEIWTVSCPFRIPSGQTTLLCITKRMKHKWLPWQSNTSVIDRVNGFCPHDQKTMFFLLWLFCIEFVCNLLGELIGWPVGVAAQTNTSRHQQTLLKQNRYGTKGKKFSRQKQMELTARTIIIIAQTNSHGTNQNTQQEVISPSVYSVTRNMAGSEKLM